MQREVCLIKRLEENPKAHPHIRMFYIQKIEGEIRQEIQEVEVKA